MMQCKILLTFLFLNLFQKYRAIYSKECRVLVLQDGGDHVYFQSGAVKTLLQKYDYDVIVANGFAGLIGIQVAQGKTGAQIIEYWKSFDQTHVLENWYLGIAEALINKPSFYNTTILLDTVQKLVESAPLIKKLSILSTNINNGMPFYVNENSSIEELSNGIAGSASQPYYFQPVSFQNKKLVQIVNTNKLSGSLINSVDFQTAITKCKQLSGPESQIIVDSVLTSEKSISQKETSNYKSYQMLDRYLQLNSYVKVMKSFVHAYSDNPTVIFQHIITYSDKLSHSIVPFGNSKKVNDKMILQGEADAEVQMMNQQQTQVELLYYLEKTFSNLYHPDLQNDNENLNVAQQ